MLDLDPAVRVYRRQGRLRLAACASPGSTHVPASSAVGVASASPSAR